MADDPSQEAVDTAAREYEARELTYLLAVRDEASRTKIGEAAAAVRDAARAWEKASLEAYFAKKDDPDADAREVYNLDRQHEIVETLRELWTDLAAVQSGQNPPTRVDLPLDQRRPA